MFFPDSPSPSHKASDWNKIKEKLISSTVIHLDRFGTLSRDDKVYYTWEQGRCSKGRKGNGEGAEFTGKS